MIMFAEFLLIGYPGGFPWFYLVTLVLLMLMRLAVVNIHCHDADIDNPRFFTYKAIKNHFFMLDFCYFVQVGKNSNETRL